MRNISKKNKKKIRKYDAMYTKINGQKKEIINEWLNKRKKISTSQSLDYQIPSHVRAEYASLSPSEGQHYDASKTPKLSSVREKRQSACSGISVRVHRKTPEPASPVGGGK